MDDQDFVILVEFDDEQPTSNAPVYRDFGDRSGGAERGPVQRGEDGVDQERSRKAIDNAFQAVGWVAKKAAEALKAVAEPPDEAEFEFGIKLTTKAGIIVAQADAEFHIKARLVWRKKAE